MDDKHAFLLGVSWAAGLATIAVAHGVRAERAVACIVLILVAGLCLGLAVAA